MSRANELFQRIKEEGVDGIAKLVDDREPESLWLDFKRSSDDGAGSKLSKNDLETFARAVSGFGNSDGGVIVWGVDCRKDASGADLPAGMFPIEQPAAFVTKLQERVSACTSPAHRYVESIAIVTTDEGNGFVATLIPKNLDAPLQCIQPNNRLRYLMRASTEFIDVPHAVLSGMFGRRPQPELRLVVLEASQASFPSPSELGVSVQFLVENLGPSIARGLWVLVRAQTPGERSSLLPGRSDHGTWNAYGQDPWCFVSQDNVRLPPGARSGAITLGCSFRSPFNSGLGLELSWGAEDTPVSRVSHTLSRPEFHVAYDELLDLSNQGRLHPSAAVGRLLGLRVD